MDARQAKKHYKELTHLEEMEKKEERLYRVVRAKYEQNPKLLEKLCKTGDMLIIFDTTESHDNELGRCLCRDCQGKDIHNLYGKVLTRVREELRQTGKKA